MGRESILEEVKHFTTMQELYEHDWTKFIGKTKIQQVEPGKCLDTNIDAWTFRHLYEEGLTATFKKNDDGTLLFRNCKDVTK